MRVASLWAAVAGAAVQAALMWHSPVDCYPYKMMTNPSDRFYAGIALLAVAVSVVITVAVCRTLRVQWCVLAVLIGVPVVFLVTFVLAHSLARVDMLNPLNNFDRKTPAMVLSEFCMEVARRILVVRPSGRCGASSPKRMQHWCRAAASEDPSWTDAAEGGWSGLDPE